MKLIDRKKCCFYRVFIIFLLLLCVTSKAQATNNYDTIKSLTNKYKMGLNPINEIEYETFEKSALNEVFEENKIEIPTQIDLSSDFPQPRNQGDQMSCVGWSVAYAYKSYQEKIENQWGLSADEYVFSPSYVYNQINNGVDKGAYIEDAMQILVDQGVSPLSSMPYDENDYITQPNDEQKQIATKFKAERWLALPLGDLETMKAHLTNKDAIVIGFPVFQDFLKLNFENSIWDLYEGRVLGYHLVCVVGYDDTKEAFKVINSWGTEWGQNGYGWISYDAMKIFCVEAYVMVDIIEKIDDSLE